MMAAALSKLTMIGAVLDTFRQFRTCANLIYLRFQMAQGFQKRHWRVLAQQVSGPREYQFRRSERKASRP